MINKNNNGEDVDTDIDLNDDSFGYDDLDDADVPEFDEDEIADEDQDWQEDPQPVNKKTARASSSRSGDGLSFNTMVIIGAVILGAGVLVFNIMSQSGKQAEQTNTAFQSSMSVSDVLDGGLTTAAQNTQDSTTPAPVGDVPVDAEQPTANNDGGFLSDDNNTLDTQSQVNTPPQPSPMTPSDGAEGITPLPEQQAMNAVVVEENSAEKLLKEAIENRDDMATIQEIAPVVSEYPTPSTPDQTPVDVNVAQDPVTPAPSEPAVVADMVAPIAPAPVVAAVDTKLVEKLDQVLSRMDKIEAEIGTLKQDKTKGMEALEQTVSSLREELSSVKSTKQSSPEVVKKDVANVEKPAASEKIVKKSPPKPKKAVTKPKPETAYQVPVTWELRAAQPGRAWVSKSGERDMQTVEVGQTLAGIGKINAITYQNGRWVVQGSQGQIRQ